MQLGARHRGSALQTPRSGDWRTLKEFQFFKVARAQPMRWPPKIRVPISECNSEWPPKFRALVSDGISEYIA